MSASPTTLYVHVPFCVVKCGYCDFNSYRPDGDGALDAFLDGLDRELALAHPPRRPATVFIGGGTPSYLDSMRLTRLFAILRRHVDLDAIEEVTMEANPESVTEEKGAIAKDAGVSRMSVGVQTFDAARLAFLDRAHDAEQTGAAVRALRAAGIDNLSLDLMFGLPGQSPEEWQRDLDAALELGPDHLSCYNLTFEPGTRLERDRRAGRVTPNDGERDREMFTTTRERLTERGFVAYEISNFAGRGGPCRHNDLYWLQANYVGVGPGASSHRDGVRATNLKPLEAWHAAIARGVPPVAEAETLTRRQRIAEALWLGIRRREGVDLAALRARLGDTSPWSPTIERLVDDGLVTHRDDRVALTDAGLLFADSVGEALLTAVGDDASVRGP